MTAQFVQQPEPWQRETRACDWCGCETEHQFVTHRGAWICLECGTHWRTPEGRQKARREVAGLTPADVWGGD